MTGSTRWLFHILRANEVSWGNDGRYRTKSLELEGFIHASYKDRVEESARLYFEADADLRVLAIDPRRLDVPVEVASTPRGPMPHIRGPIPCDAFTLLSSPEETRTHDDLVTGTRIALAAFDGMTLLDLVGPLDVVSRIASMGFDPKTTCEVIALTRPANDPTVKDVVVWRGSGTMLVASRFRPALDAFDVLILPGGPSVRALLADGTLIEYLASFPHNRLVASVCTGALLLGAAGRLHGKRATTHASALDHLGALGAQVVTDVRVVDEGQIVTSGGVTAGIDLGLHLVQRLAGPLVADAIAERIEWRCR